MEFRHLFTTLTLGAVVMSSRVRAGDKKGKPETVEFARPRVINDAIGRGREA